MLTNEFGGTAQVALDAAPADVFAVITDVERLPEWNAHIHHVITRPDGPLADGVEWVVHIRAMGTSWPSRG